MRKSRIIFTCLITLVTILLSCKKDFPEGPKIGLFTVKECLTNNWKPEKVTMNGEDVTAYYVDNTYTEFYNKKGDYGNVSKFGGNGGDWRFQSENDKSKIELKLNMGGKRILTVKRLTMRSYWYTYTTSSGSVYEFHLVPN